MRNIRLGDVTISAILEHQKLGMAPETLFPDSDPETVRGHYADMEPFLFDAETGRIVLAFQSFVIRTPRSIILVDTCNGPDKFGDAITWDVRPWLDRLQALGLTVADIDYVLCTHLHIDHTGWNTKLEGGRWVPTFPKARYIFSRREYWREVAETDLVPRNQRNGVWETNCLPVAEAGQAILIGDTCEVDANVSITPTPGHYCVRIQSGGLEAIALGDAMHHVLQCREPDWSTPFCWDPALAAQSRRALLEVASETSAVLLPTHFPAPTAGRVVPDAVGGYFYRFLDD